MKKLFAIGLLALSLIIPSVGSFAEDYGNVNVLGTLDVAGNTTHNGGVYIKGSSTGNTKIQSGLSSTASNTLTLPITATDTLAGLGTAQTFSALQTFGNNISIGGKAYNITSLTTGDLQQYNGTNWVNVTPASLAIGGVKNDGTVNPTNLFSNGDFENWSAGTSAAPDGWTFSGGSGGLIAINATAKIGTYSVQLIKGGLSIPTLYQDIQAVKGIDYWKGRTVTFGCWVYASVANRGRIYISDGVVNTYSSYHTGSSTFEGLTVTTTVNSAATFLRLAMEVQPDSAASFDGAMCVEGASAFAFSDNTQSGTGALQLVRLDGSAKLPAVDGSQLTNLPTTTRSQLFTSTGTFTAPTGVTTVYITGCAAGGGGGGYDSGQHYGASGAGSGAYVFRSPYLVTAGNSYTVTIGANGTGGATNNNGTDATNSSFGSYTLVGGKKGLAGATSAVGGAGGTATTISFTPSGATPGGVAYAGISSIAGTAGANSSSYIAGGGAGSPFGYGGAGDSNSCNGTGFGAGGGGGGQNTKNAGGNGAPAIILVEW